MNLHYISIQYGGIIICRRKMSINDRSGGLELKFFSRTEVRIVWDQFEVSARYGIRRTTSCGTEVLAAFSLLILGLNM
jgi:hypothetical protein